MGRIVGGSGGGQAWIGFVLKGEQIPWAVTTPDIPTAVNVVRGILSESIDYV